MSRTNAVNADVLALREQVAVLQARVDQLERLLGEVLSRPVSYPVLPLPAAPVVPWPMQPLPWRPYWGPNEFPSVPFFPSTQPLIPTCGGDDAA